MDIRPLTGMISVLMRDRALCLTRTEWLALDPGTGKARFRFPFEPPIRNSVTGASPLVVDNQIFLSACYDAGAVMLRVAADSYAVEKVWAGDDILSNHY